MADGRSFALITGCSSGIGQELAVAFAARGVTVLATARRTESLNDLTSKYSNIKALALELSDPESIARLKDTVVKETGGRLDYLINNAGTHYAVTATDLELGEVAALFQVNVFAVMQLCQLFVPLLRQSPRGRIVQIGSVTRNLPMEWQSAYNASKAALSQYSRTLRLEVQPLGIEVVEIVTGFVQSNILHHGLHAPDGSVYLPIKGVIEDIKYRGNAKSRIPSGPSSLCNQDLITAMAIITGKLTHTPAGDEGPDLDAGLDSLLSSSLLENDLVGDALSLDQFRKAYILAFYEFHQFPGHHSWLRIGRVTRMAYRIGLDRPDHMRTLYPDWSALGDDDIQEWRALWWRIYRLDTYSNLASGTPYMIDDAIINTGFSLSQTNTTAHGVFLPPNGEGLPALLPALTADPDTLLDNIHNITIATMRQAGLVIRMYMLRWRAGILAQVALVERRLTTLRLALPPGWLNPRRSAFSNKSPAAHHARLITRVLEACQDIAGLAAQWDSAFCLAVDPAITFTIFTTLIFFDLHRKSGAVLDDALRASIEHDITVLHLQLKHFGRIWTQAHLLALSFEGFTQSVSGPLSYDHITLILSRFEEPLHPHWLQFLATAQPALEACR
ncbi:NAD(P)-binding protein [Aspergillus carlsbadensis]|nr:NAD(P)-binding protein [Aspergillus carlsbadensis]